MGELKPESAFRMCVGCSRRRPKSEMIRIGAAPWTVSVGPVKKAGRGAYVCRGEECVRSAVSSGRLEKALRTKVPPGVYHEIVMTTKESCEIGENDQGP